MFEYNPKQCTETKLCNIGHRFNTLNRINTNNATFGIRQESPYYNPFYSIYIKSFSNYLSQATSGSTESDGVKSWANLVDGQWLWREILQEGYSEVSQEDNLNIPFINNCHMVESLINFKLYRQDAFGNYGLYYSGQYPDIYGGLYFAENFLSYSQQANSC